VTAHIDLGLSEQGSIPARVTRWAGAKTASVLPKKHKLLNRAPKKSTTDLQKKAPVSSIQAKKSATDLQK